MTAVATARPCWTDLSTTDVAGAEHFYRELLGWGIRHTETPMGEYLIGMVGDQEVAGMMARPPAAAGAPATWTIYCWVADLDAVVAHTAVAGGSVLQAPFEVPGGNRVAMVADPTGAVLGLMSGSAPPGASTSMAPGTATWYELMTGDPASAKRFYADLLGWTSEADDADGIGYTVFSDGDSQVAGMIARPADIGDGVPDSWSVYFSVADCASSEARTRDLGGQVLKPATPTPMGPFAVIADPRGAVFQIAAFTRPSE